MHACLPEVEETLQVVHHRVHVLNLRRHRLRLAPPLIAVALILLDNLHHDFALRARLVAVSVTLFAQIRAHQQIGVDVSQLVIVEGTVQVLKRLRD